MCTHYDGTSTGLTVDTLVPQVENQGGGAIKKRKNTDADKEFS